MYPSPSRLSLIFTLSAVLASDVKTYLDDVSYQANGLKQKIDGWTADAGLEGALSIQESFPDLESSVSALASSLKSATDSDIDVDATKSMVETVSNLLDSLSSKASDFQSVGASTIVAKDISSLNQPALDVVNDIAKTVANDCDKTNALNPALQKFSSGFSNAGQSYGVTVANFPSSISCSGSSRTSSSSSSNSINSGSTSSPLKTAEHSSLVTTIVTGTSISTKAAAATNTEKAGAHATSAPWINPQLSNGTTPDVSRNGTYQHPPILPTNGASAVKPIAATLVLVTASLLLL